MSPTNQLHAAIARARAAVHAASGYVSVSTITAAAAPAAPRVCVPVQTPAPLPAAPPAPSCADHAPTARRIFEELHRLAVEVAARRGQSRATVAVFHLPAELLAARLDIHPATLYRHLPALHAAGLVHSRAHFGTSRGVTRATGTLWAVALREGARARLRWVDLNHAWRDLDADRDAKRTAWAFLRESENQLVGELGFQRLLKIAVHGFSALNPVESDSRTAGAHGLEAVWALPDLLTAPKRERADRITAAALQLARLLGDHHSTRFYAGLLYAALRASWQGLDLITPLQNALTRVHADLREGYARKPGALLVSRLRKDGTLDALNAA